MALLCGLLNQVESIMYVHFIHSINRNVIFILYSYSYTYNNNIIIPSTRLLLQGYHGTAIGKAKGAAKTELEKLKLSELTCRQAIKEVARMYVFLSSL